MNALKNLDNQKKIIIIGAVAVLILIALGLKFLGGGSVMTEDPLKNQVVSTDDPVDIALDFYDAWQKAVEADGTDPFAAGLADEPLLSQVMRDKLSNLPERKKSDPVLCLDVIPEKITSKQLYMRDDETQILIFSKEYPMAGQSIITMGGANGGWYIKDISCSEEFDGPKEFSFENEGNLLKTVPEPYDSRYWHLVYARDGVFGYLVPMFFNESSICVSIDGGESQCDENNLPETKPVMLRGNMTEAGVEVKRLEFLPDL
tara:strand:- start:1515 stop:2294 length:780 start_codon:yes stop_codon:yes gene_type:complete